MKRLLCVLLTIFLLTGCAEKNTVEEWATGTIVDLSAKHVSYMAGKAVCWQTRYYMTLKLDNYDGEYTIRISEDALVSYLLQDDDKWMGILCKNYIGDKLIDANIEDMDLAEEITILGGNEIGTHDPEMYEYVTGEVLTVLKVYYESGTLYTCYAYLHLDGYSGIHRVEVPEVFCDTFYFSTTKSFIATLQKFYNYGRLTKTMIDDMVFTD